MFAAKAAALRTLDLSRQVGAAIFSADGEIISMGSNEVPKAGAALIGPTLSLTIEIMSANMIPTTEERDNF